ncbi:MAG: GNAT family N-acetyltransferase [Phenylobacterium sp.]|jgi:GNAT superfamily N-acetyltransferase|nr:GNAT family N-acetyltransferase [Phenylobacterium sp.]MDZ4052385.1 GNAT family N-acetyltransferase [Phenylobacterium sp.]MDZ4317514.1 GNAT family N-acetyltransferase [Phenylobacterium sp.]
MQDVIIRRAHADDIQTLAEVGRATFTETFGHLYPPEDLGAFLNAAYGTAYLAEALADPDRALWLAELEGQAVGHALAGPCDLPHPAVGPGSLEVKRLYLRKSVQGGGLGARLFEAVLAWLERDGPQDLWLGVWSDNHGAQRFYRRYGFSPVGEYGFPVGATVDREFIFRRMG